MFDKQKRRLVFTIIVALFILFLGIAAKNSESRNSLPHTNYNLFCINGKLEISSRSLESLQSFRSSNVCFRQSKDESDYKEESKRATVGYINLLDAYEKVRNMGGVNSACSCEHKAEDKFLPTNEKIKQEKVKRENGLD